MRGVYCGEGPSSKVNATAFSVRAGPLGRNRSETSSCERAPLTISCSPGVRLTVNCGSLALPEKQPGKQRPDNHGDEHNRTHNAHSPQHHAPFTFVIRRTTLPEPAPPITRSYVSVAAISP